MLSSSQLHVTTSLASKGTCTCAQTQSTLTPPNKQISVHWSTGKSGAWQMPLNLVRPWLGYPRACSSTIFSPFQVEYDLPDLLLHTHVHKNKQTKTNPRKKASFTYPGLCFTSSLKILFLFYVFKVFCLQLGSGGT